MILAPEPRPRPKFAYWLYDRRLTNRAVAPGLGCSHETVRLICLPFADPDRRVPRATLLASIVALTDGEITERDFHQVRERAA